MVYQSPNLTGLELHLFLLNQRCHPNYQVSVCRLLLGLNQRFFFVGELLLKKFQKMTIIISIVNAKNANENEVLPSLLVIKPTTTKPIAAIKISNEEVRTTHCDDHFIQEPLASV